MPKTSTGFVYRQNTQTLRCGVQDLTPTLGITFGYPCLQSARKSNPNGKDKPGLVQTSTLRCRVQNLTST